MTTGVSRKTCENCWHGRDGRDCKVKSIRCATAVFNMNPEPPRWMDFNEGVEREMKNYLIIKQGGKPYGRVQSTRNG